jgi:multimeric flavodoxin WrbA
MLGSPTESATVSVEMKCLIDRCGMISGSNGGTLRHKVGAAVIAVRRGGAICAFDTVCFFYSFILFYYYRSITFSQSVR